MPIAPKSLNKPIGESYWVIEDRLLAGRYPGGKTAKEAERRVAALIEAGFDAFIDLTEPDELPPYDLYLPGSVSYVRKPIPDHGCRGRGTWRIQAARRRAGRGRACTCTAGLA
jgi:hypothetical protein